MDNALERLKVGASKFQASIYRANSEAYRHAGTEPQTPYALIVACADSRVDVETITDSKPGDIFITRNIGNMVPPFGAMLGGVSAVIEYAVTALHVQHVVVCGHSDCGAMKALLKPESTEAMPTVRNWLLNGASALSVASTFHRKQQRDLLPVLTEQNVLAQIAHLKTHPSVAGAVARGDLTISGWVYDIATGEIHIAESASEDFLPLSENHSHKQAEG